MKKIYVLLFTILMTATSFGQDLVITSAFDAPLPGGFPKGIEIYVVNDIADISIYGLEIAGNGGASGGAAVYNFPADAYTAGDFIYVGKADAASAAAFLQYYGVVLTYQTDEVSHNGDDTILLYNGGTVVDAWGDLGVDGTGTAWDSVDGWGYRVDGQGPNATFTVAEWTFSGANATDGCDLADDTGTNAGCASVNPIGTYSPIPSAATTIAINSPANLAILASGTTSVDIAFTTANLNAGDQVDITVTKNGGSPTTTMDVMSSPFNIAGTADGDTFEVTAEIVNGATQIDFETINFSIDLIVATDLVLNEFLADPAADPNGDANGDGTRHFSDDEFIEIYNTGASIDLEGYTISDGFGVRHTFTGTVLPAGSFMTVFGGGTPTGISGMVQVADDLQLGLNNGGDVITIRNASAQKVIEYAYGSEGGNNTSLARDPDFSGAFVLHDAHSTNPVEFSPGARNDGTLSVAQNDIEGFAIYPNPVNSGEFSIRSMSNLERTIQIYDMLGKQVYTKQVQANERVQVSNLTQGIYILKVEEEGKTATRKLIIE